MPRRLGRVGERRLRSQFHRPGRPHSQDRIATGRQTVRPGGVSLAPPSFPLSLLLAGTRLPRGWRKAPEGSGAGQAGAVSQGGRGQAGPRVEGRRSQELWWPVNVRRDRLRSPTDTSKLDLF